MPVGKPATVGSWIKVREQGSDEEEVYQLTRVTNAIQNQLAADNSMGKALIGSRPGDEVTMDSPAGPIKFEVLEVNDGNG